MSSRIRFSTSQQIGEAFPALNEDLNSPLDAKPPIPFAEKLLAGKTPEDAVTFCAYMLPRREAVWWACQCLRVLQSDFADAEQENLRLAEEWVRNPDEANRVMALRTGMGADKSAPATWLALAVAWSGGSMVENEEYPVPPPPELTAKSANAAILSALAFTPASDRAGKLKACVEACIRFANGEELEIKGY